MSTIKDEEAFLIDYVAIRITLARVSYPSHVASGSSFGTMTPSWVGTTRTE